MIWTAILRISRSFVLRLCSLRGLVLDSRSSVKGVFDLARDVITLMSSQLRTRLRDILMRLTAVMNDYKFLNTSF